MAHKVDKIAAFVIRREYTQRAWCMQKDKCGQIRRIVTTRKLDGELRVSLTSRIRRRDYCVCVCLIRTDKRSKTSHRRRIICDPRRWLGCSSCRRRPDVRDGGGLYDLRTSRCKRRRTVPADNGPLLSWRRGHQLWYHLHDVMRNWRTASAVLSNSGSGVTALLMNCSSTDCYLNLDYNLNINLNLNLNPLPRVSCRSTPLMCDVAAKRWWHFATSELLFVKWNIASPQLRSGEVVFHLTTRNSHARMNREVTRFVSDINQAYYSQQLSLHIKLTNMVDFYYKCTRCHYAMLLCRHAY